MKNKKLVLISTVVTLIIFFAAGAWLYKTKEKERIGFLALENFKTFVPDHAPVMGADIAQVYVVEFMDPECESCRAFHPIMKMLMNEFEGKIKLVIRYAPFHGNSEYIIKVLEAARKQNKYWEALDVLFQYQPYWGDHHHPQPELVWTYLPQAGVDIEKAKADLDDPASVQLIEQDRKDGMALGVRQTPTFFVNGRQLESFGEEGLRQLITEELSK